MVFLKYRENGVSTPMTTFKTIRQTAAMGLMTEHYLRLLVAQGKCPGIRSGNRFLINVEALAEQLDEESRRGCKESAVANV